LSFYLERSGHVAALAADARTGLALPSVQTILNDQDAKLSRVVCVYVNRGSYALRSDVREFIDFFPSGATRFVQYARLVPLTERNYQDSLAKLRLAIPLQ
jgi:ABC-type phosphate transport system substrate-binding protein